ncbi:alpha-glycosidase [Paenibacillus sp. IB182496]|uniref:Alpha-glycosidase n=1 Tax=Paenibacillus sabuli TaxID=2772509 RepID=A0A927BP72_9BACL|nr:alpha-glycosidase [Paenibacillus sabuli]MBD2843712.1 alpha-glycosidase [Paenibacillus sabuli]
MQIESFYHAPRSNWSYTYDKHTIHLRLRTKRDDVEEVVVEAGDKYDWEGHSDDHPMVRIAADSLFDYWEVGIRPQHKRLSYCFRIRAGSETLWMTESGVHSERATPPGGYYEYPYIHAIDIFSAPEWAKSAVFYQIMPDRFANGDPDNDPEHVRPWGVEVTHESHFGGDLQGVLDHLDHLSELGVNAIYFTPLFTSPSNHKYDTVDYREVDPQFGDKALLRKVVDACHKRNIKVVLDAVLNHCSEDFEPFRDVLEKGEDSAYKDWFHIHKFPPAVEDGKANYETFGFFGHMPKLNTANPETKRYLLELTEYWMNELGIDGWRLDVADEVDHHFWREYRQVVKKMNPEAYIIGEVWSDSMTWLQGDQFDSVMNYPFANTALDFFSGAGMDGAHFANRLSALLMRYPQQTNEVIFNLLSGHDIPRVLTRLGEDKRRVKLAVVFLMTYIGTPCIFYGDEIGLKGGDDPDCRPCMVWEEERQDRELFDFYRLLIGLRSEHPVLRRGHFRFLKSDISDLRIVYERLDEEMHMTVWMNNTEEPATLAHPMETDDWQDALSGEAVPLTDGELRVELAPLDYRILYRTIS